MTLPSSDELEQFAPTLDSDDANYQKELGRKRVWLRRIQGKDPWRSLEEAQPPSAEAGDAA